MTAERVTTHRWEGDPSRLDRALAESGLARSRSHASDLVAEGAAFIDGVLAGKPGARVQRGSTIEIRGGDHYVSRGAHKLIAALDEFDIDPRGRLALDLGASTGGFTQVLLERGASEVLAIDVGHDQLAQALREDPRVRVVEGCNARDLDAGSLAELTGVSEAPTLVVADLSFISLTLILPAIAQCVGVGADLALLIKPQFEVGRVRDGVVTDPELWGRAIRAVLECAEQHGFSVRGLAPSPIAGGEGNREFLVHLVSGLGIADGERGNVTQGSEASADPPEWEWRVREVTTMASGASTPEGSDS